MKERIAYLGPNGTYTEIAAKQVSKEAEWLPLPSIDQVFDSVRRGDVHRGVVPYENMIHGLVTETLDALLRLHSELWVNDMRLLDIQHALGVLPDGMERIEDIGRVYSKDQALAQCRLFLTQHCPALRAGDEGWVAMPSTAAALAFVVEHQVRDAAVIAHADSLKAAGLRVIAHDVADQKNNKTRFAVIAKRSSQTVLTNEVTPTMGTALPGSHHRAEPAWIEQRQGWRRFAATAISVYPRRNRIGMLQDILSVISGQFGLNLSSIHSRPDALGAFRFFIEIEGRADAHQVRECVGHLRSRFGAEDIEVLVLGTYPRMPFQAQKLSSIGIVGGSGMMGQWLTRFFHQAGLEVRTWDKGDSRLGIETVDAVLVSVPIESTENVIHELGPKLRSGQVWVDNTSVKVKPVEWMLERAPEGVEVLGMHTVFGPTVTTLKGQNVIFTPTERSGELSEEFQGLMYKWGAQVTQTTPEQHDRQMAFHQCLEHIVHVALAQTYPQAGAKAELLRHFTSPNSEQSLEVARRILNGNPSLYAAIQRFNPYAQQTLKIFGSYFDGLVRQLEQGNFEAFAAAMVEAQRAI